MPSTLIQTSLFPSELTEVKTVKKLKKEDWKSFADTFISYFWGYRHDIVTAFDDFLTIQICLFARQTEEELYLQTIKKYDRQDLDAFIKITSRLWAQYYLAQDQKDWIDPLGDLYEEITSRHKSSMMGQFFTPKTICDLMAMIGANPEEFNQKVNDPACGSGRLLLAHEKASRGNYLIGADLDNMCAKMAAINCCMHNHRAEIYHGDTLQNKYFKVYIVNYDYRKTKTPSIFIKHITPN